MDIQLLFVTICVALALIFIVRKIQRTLKGQSLCDGCKGAASSCDSCHTTGKIADFRAKCQK